MTDGTMPRRTVLRGLALAGAAGLAAACGQGPDLSTKATGRKPLWKHTFATADNGHITPGSENDDLFPYSMAASDTTFYASFEGKLYAFDTAGRQLWQSPYGHYNASPMYGRTAPLVLEGTLYTLRNEPGGKGALQALDPGTGRLRWSFAPGGWLSPPAASGGHVAVSSTAHLHCLDAATGEERWRAGGIGFPGGPAIADGVVCAVDARMYLAGLDVKTGRTRWHRSGSSTGGAGLFEPHSSITSDGDTVYIHSMSGLWAVSARDGRVLWSGTTAGGLTPVVPSGGVVYAAGTGGVSAITAGNASWTVPVPHWASGADRPLAFAAGALIFTTDGRVSSVDARSGAPRWTAAIKDYADEDVPLSNAATANHIVCVLAKDEAVNDDAGNKDGPVDHLYAFPA
ncbi:PQQ-binding-like beta-propeller repeat protein [Actinomadura sp. NPDC048394]|uniref:PQQ-binding-like beta-propeller repeat protein n=1 Tax=Actinomadura sp. NPDC048394 TaxID=3158223 RepID=UPI00340B6DA1